MSFLDRLLGRTEEPQEQLALDGFWQGAAGHGTDLDMSTGAKFRGQCLSLQQLCELFEQNGLAKAAVGRIYEDGIRNGFILTAPDEDPEKLSKVRQELNQWFETNEGYETVLKSLTQGDLFGGSVLLQVSDSQDQEMPYEPGRGSEPRFLALSPMEIYGHEIETNPMERGYRFPITWAIKGAQAEVKIHRSWARVTTSGRIANPTTDSRWYGESVLHSFHQQLRAWDTSIQAGTHALQEISRTVYKLQNAAMLAGAGEEAQMRIRRRIKSIESAASVFQPSVLDMSESVERMPISVGGIGEVLDRIIVSMCGHARMPVTVLFGTSPGGFSEGVGEMRLWLDRVRFAQRTKVRPMLRWMLERLFDSGAVKKPKGDWSITFPPLVTPSESEDAALRNLIAQSDSIYVSAGVLSPEEIAEARFGGDWSMETELDREARERDAMDDQEEVLTEEEEAEARDFAMRMGRAPSEEKNVLLRGAAGGAKRPNLNDPEQHEAQHQGIDSE